MGNDVFRNFPQYTASIVITYVFPSIYLSFKKFPPQPSFLIGMPTMLEIFPSWSRNNNRNIPFMILERQHCSSINQLSAPEKLPHINALQRHKAQLQNRKRQRQIVSPQKSHLVHQKIYHNRRKSRKRSLGIFICNIIVFVANSFHQHATTLIVPNWYSGQYLPNFATNNFIERNMLNGKPSDFCEDFQYLRKTFDIRI